MTGPEVRERLIQKAAQHNDPELLRLAEELKRRKPVKKSKPVSVAMTDEIRQKIRNVHVQFPHLTNRQIGNLFNVDSGRVSEALAGKRE